MKKFLALALSVVAACGLASADDVYVARDLKVESFDLARNGHTILVSLDLDADQLKLGRDHEITLMPVLMSADSSKVVEMDPVTIAGHNLYWLHMRDRNLDPNTRLYKSGKQDVIRYSTQIDDAPWIDNSEFAIAWTKQTCCGQIEGIGRDPLVRIATPTYTPVFDYITNVEIEDSVKVRHLDGSAYIDFPVNLTKIFPDYHNNTYELNKITGTIDSVKADPDVTITSISIKGFASPEGSYSNNVRLAKGRTAALKAYVDEQYSFADDFIQTSYEPEDWEGLRRWLERNPIDHREQILAIVDSDLEPDPKNTKIQRTYPAEYQFLLKTVYPFLRHSDYRIEYQIRSFTTLEDIMRVMRTEPQKLSLNEFYRAAAALEPGSRDYNEVFETAVRMFPNDPVTNLNAANSALTRGDLISAEAYLKKADADDPTVIYTKGVLAALHEDWDQAVDYFQQAARLKVADAPRALESAREMKAFKDGATYHIGD